MGHLTTVVLEVTGLESHDDGCILWLRIPSDGIPLA